MRVLVRVSSAKKVGFQFNREHGNAVCRLANSHRKIIPGKMAGNGTTACIN